MEWMKNLSDEDLIALEQGNFAAISDAGLQIIEQASPQGIPTTGTMTPQGMVVEPSFSDTVGEVGRQVGLTARGGITGVTAPATMIGDPLNQLINMIAGTNLPPASESLQNLLNMVGLPQPKNAQERVVQDVLGGMSGVGAAPAIARGVSKVAPKAAASMSPLMQRLGTQTVAGGAAGGGAGGAREAGGGTGAQLTAGLGLGLIAPTVTGTLGATQSGLRALGQPFSRTGQERMAGNLLRQQATDPLAATQRMEQYSPPVPGSQPTMAATSGDYGLASIERTLSQFPEAAGEYAKRQAQNNAARNLLMEKYTADKVLDDAIIKRDAITEPIRTNAFANKNQVKPTAVVEKIDDILRSPVGARELVRDQLNGIKTRIQSEIGDTGFADPERLYSIRKDINDIIEGNVAGSRAENTRKVASGQLIEIRNVLDGIIENGAPGYSEYMRMYRTMSQPINQVKTMENISTKASGGTIDPQTGFRSYTPVRFSKLVEQVESDPRNPLSKTQLGVLKKVAKELDDGAIVNLPGIKPAGSDTFKNLTVASLLGNISSNPNSRGVAAELIGNFARPISWIYKGGEDAVRQLLVDAMLDPKIAAQLMRKATQQNINQVSRSLAEKAAQMGYGATFGINVAQ